MAMCVKQRGPFETWDPYFPPPHSRPTPINWGYFPATTGNVPELAKAAK